MVSPASAAAPMRAVIALLVGGGSGTIAAVMLVPVVGGSSVIWSSLALWSGMLGGTVVALIVNPTQGLFRLRLTDLLWGVGGAALLRLVWGLAAGVNETPFPSTGGLPAALSSWFLVQGLPAGIVGPTVEELFFHAVLLPALFQWLRPRVGSLTAAVASMLASAGAFVLLHAAFATLALPDLLQLLMLAVLAGLIVLLTGRVLGAVILHVAYNAAFLAAAAVGTLLSG